MAVLNCTPDSFFPGSRTHGAEAALQQARRMIAAGADIIDIGGESSRPGAQPVTLDEELRRVVPVVEALRSESDVVISVDTSKPDVARAALSAGADVVNDISGLSDPRMIEVVAAAGAPAVVMHMQGQPRTMQAKPFYHAVTAQVIAYLEAALERAQAGGVPREHLIVDPGIGFGKRLRDNLDLLADLPALATLGRPILVGISRKSFLGKVLDRPIEDRLNGTVAANALAVHLGADIIRVHDVAAAVDVVRLAAAVKGGLGGPRDRD